jgi:hypothetical protein
VSAILYGLVAAYFVLVVYEAWLFTVIAGSSGLGG